MLDQSFSVVFPFRVDSNFEPSLQSFTVQVNFNPLTAYRSQIITQKSPEGTIRLNRKIIATTLLGRLTDITDFNPSVRDSLICVGSRCHQIGVFRSLR